VGDSERGAAGYTTTSRAAAFAKAALRHRRDWRPV